MNVVFLRQFFKDIAKLKDPDIKFKLTCLLEKIESSHSLTEIRNVKKLKGHKNAYRIRIGDYRLGLFFEKNNVEFARFVHRKEIYKFFP